MALLVVASARRRGYAAFDTWDDYDLRRAAVNVRTTLDELRAMVALPALFAQF